MERETEDPMLQVTRSRLVKRQNTLEFSLIHSLDVYFSMPGQNPDLCLIIDRQFSFSIDTHSYRTIFGP